MSAAPVTAPAAAGADLEQRRSRPETVRRLRLAAPPRRRLRVAAVAVVVVLIGSLFCLVGLNILMVQGQFELDQLEVDVQVEQRRYEALRLEVAELVSPDRIIESAAELGLSAPDSITYIEVSSDVTIEPAPSDALDADTTLAETWAQGKGYLARRS